MGIMLGFWFWWQVFDARHCTKRILSQTPCQIQFYSCGKLDNEHKLFVQILWYGHFLDTKIWI